MIAEYQNKFNSAIVETLLDMDDMSQSSLEHLINVVGENQYDRGVITTDPATSIIPMRASIPRRYSRTTGKRYTMLPGFLLPHYQYTKSFIFLTLYCYKCRRCQSVRDLCSRTGIAVTTLYRWKAAFMQDLNCLILRSLLIVIRSRQIAPHPAHARCRTTVLCQITVTDSLCPSDIMIVSLKLRRFRFAHCSENTHKTNWPVTSLYHRLLRVMKPGESALIFSAFCT